MTTIAELQKIRFPKAGCPRCLYYGSFDKVTRHMFRKNHLYEGYGTYPLHITDLPTLVAMGYESLDECHVCRETVITARFGCWPGWQVAYAFCSRCPILREAITVEVETS